MKFPVIPGFDPQAFDKYLKNAGWLMLGKILSMVVAFMIARYLGPSAFGDLSTVEALTAIVAAVSMLGLDSFVIRELIREPEKRDEILGTAFLMRFWASLLLMPITIGTYLLLRAMADIPGPSLTGIVLLYAVASVFKSFNVIDSWFQSQVLSRYVVYVQNSCLVLSSIVKIYLILSGASLVWFAASLVFDGAILAAGLSLVFVRRGLSLAAWHYSKSRARSLLRQSWPLIISAVMVSLYMKIGALMLKSSLGSAAVGVYSAAARLSESWYFIPVAIATSVLPAIIHARKTDPEKYLRRLQNLYDLLVCISLPVAIGITFVADDLIHLIYQDRFAGAGPMLAIHIWSGVFVFLGIASSQYLLSEGYNKISFIRTGIGAVVNIGLNLWLIPLYGGVGASVATAIAYFVSVFSILLFPHTRRQGWVMLESLLLISVTRKLFGRSGR